MKIALIDADSKIPNLALMKLSSYHKECGDEVGFYNALDPDGYDRCYVSKVFDFTPYPQYLPNCETVYGGTGCDINAKLADDVERSFPDYSLYNCEYAIGRFTRGCPNNCPWCVVPKMDGNDVRKVADLNDFWDGQRTVRVLDDNIMADEEAFVDACGQLSSAGVHALWEALDIRRVNQRTARALASVKQEKRIHFAWDGPSQDGFIESGLSHLREAGLKPWRFTFYVLVGFNTSREYDIYRINRLRELGANPFVMPFDKSDRYQKDLARWCNNKFIFKSCGRFEDYDCPTNR